ncbi:ODV-EC27 [Helicoverpa armigera SNPV]|nr:ODV-EC27 [Helicoverpa armigera SNPV]
MKKFKCQSNKIRTVTEIINADEKLHKDYDLADFNAKNLNSLESYDNLQIKMILAKYMAMLNMLELTQPLLATFRDKNAIREIVSIVFASLGFVHNRVNPMINHFNSKMEFIVTENRNASIPGEPLFFCQHDNGDVVCYIDRPSILQMLSKDFDLDVDVNNMHKERNKYMIAKTFRCTPKRRHSREREPPPLEINLTETDVTQYMTLLFIHEHAYLHYYILKNYGVVDYSRSLSDHTLFSNKSRPTLNMKFSNLLLSKFKFSIEDYDSINTKNTNKNLGILTYTD